MQWNVCRPDKGSERERDRQVGKAVEEKIEKRGNGINVDSACKQAKSKLKPESNLHTVGVYRKG